MIPPTVDNASLVSITYRPLRVGVHQHSAAVPLCRHRQELSETGANKKILPVCVSPGKSKEAAAEDLVRTVKIIKAGVMLQRLR